MIGFRVMQSSKGNTKKKRLRVPTKNEIISLLLQSD